MCRRFSGDYSEADLPAVRIDRPTLDRPWLGGSQWIVRYKVCKIHANWSNDKIIGRVTVSNKNNNNNNTRAFIISGILWSWWGCLWICLASKTMPSGTAIPSLFNRFSARRSVLKASSGILPPNAGSTCSRKICRFRCNGNLSRLSAIFRSVVYFARVSHLSRLSISTRWQRASRIAKIFANVSNKFNYWLSFISLAILSSLLDRASRLGNDLSCESITAYLIYPTGALICRSHALTHSSFLRRRSWR